MNVRPSLFRLAATLAMVLAFAIILPVSGQAAQIRGLMDCSDKMNVCYSVCPSSQIPDSNVGGIELCVAAGVTVLPLDAKSSEGRNHLRLQHIAGQQTMRGQNPPPDPHPPQQTVFSR